MILVTRPESLQELSTLENIKRYVSEENAKILLRINFPTNTVISVRSLLGDPNFVLSESIAHLLYTNGMLLRRPVTDSEGKQKCITIEREVNDTVQKVKSPLWEYSWPLTEETDFSILSEKDLLRVGWDLRNAPGFFNVVALNPASSVQQEDEVPADDEILEDDNDALEAALTYGSRDEEEDEYALDSYQEDVTTNSDAEDSGSVVFFGDAER